MHFVDDENFVAIPHGHDRQPVDDHFANVVDACMCRGIDFEHIDVASLGNLTARVACAAWIGRWSVCAAQRAREDPGSGRLSHATRPRKDERLSDSTPRNGVPERPRDSRLSDDVIELLRPPLSRENLVGQKKASGSRLQALGWVWGPDLR